VAQDDPRRPRRHHALSVPPSSEPPLSPLVMLGAGLDLAVALLVFLAVGWQLDRWLGTRPWLFLAGALCGMAVGFYMLYRRVTLTKS